jgi:hypothetical protein
MKRPSHKELYNKIREARKAVASESVLLLEQDAIAQDAIDLEYDIGDDLFDVLSELLDETSSKHYAGTRPPQRSYERKIEGLELFAFVVESSRFKCRIYYKFALAEGAFWLLSLHQDRPLKEEK